MMKSYIYKLLLLSCLIFAFVSCRKDYLNVSDELAGQLTLKDIFNNPVYTRQYHRNIFSGIGNSSLMIFGTASSITPTGVDNAWPAFTDELKNSQGFGLNLTATGFNSSGAPLSRWNLYLLIRQANVFMNNAKLVPPTGSVDYINQAELDKLMAQARFLRAYYHYLLFELYGPIPIMDKAVSPDDAILDFERNSVDEVVKFVTDELTAVAPQLPDIITDPNYLGEPTKGVALAIKAKMLVYAASPLYNGGYVEALSLTGPGGKKLFPVKDNTKWQKALAALQEFIDFSAGKYELYKAYSNGVYDPDLSLYELFMKMNSEIIWANGNESWGSVASGDGTTRRCTPRNQGTGLPCMAPTQELVDAFFMKNGKSINDPGSGYSETGFSTTAEVPAGRSEAGTFNMWVNREPRFYRSIFYHGRKWQVSNQVVKFNKGNGNDNSSPNYPITGYLMLKRLSKNVYNSGTFAKVEYHPSIIFRLAEFYLLYAEALNEVRPSDPKIIEYVNKVRERAGIPGLEISNPGIEGNQDLQREAIRKERRVELCFEGQRYFDVRRWMIAENPSGQGAQGGPYYGMNMGANTEAEFFKRTVYEVRAFTRASYLYPIPYSEMQKSTKLIQNPGW